MSLKSRVLQINSFTFCLIILIFSTRQADAIAHIAAVACSRESA